MLIIDKIKNGIVIDHIKAGQGVRVFNWLSLEKSDLTTAFVINAPSTRMTRKDIIKIYDTIDIDYDVLGLIDPRITVNIIENERVTEKKMLKLPERVVNVLFCRNPRCVTSTEKYIPHIFNIADRAAETYRCEYCDETQDAECFR
jgi:aspartate carbamoyltransferase regulatory subunit